VKLVGSVLDGTGASIDVQGGSGSASGAAGRILLGSNTSATFAGNTGGVTPTTFAGPVDANPFLPGTPATPDIPDLQGGAEAYGLLNLPSTAADFASLVRGGAPGDLAAVVLEPVGPTGYSDSYSGYDLLLYLNLSGQSLDSPLLGVSGTSPLVQQGVANDPTFGGSGPQVLGQFGAYDVYGTLVPANTTSVSAGFRLNGHFFSGSTDSLQPGVPLYLTGPNQPIATTTQLQAVPSIGFSGSHDQVVQVSARVSTSSGPAKAGTVIFALDAGGTASAAVNASGVAVASLTVPSETAPGTYNLTASYSAVGTPGAPDYAASSATGTFIITPATTRVTASGSASFIASDSGLVRVKAVVSTSNHDTITGGTVTLVFDGQTVQTTLLQGTAAAVFSVEAGTPAGTYPVSVSYSGTAGYAASGGSGSVTVTAARPALSVATVRVPFGDAGDRQITVSAGVSTPDDPGVSEGTVTFSYNGQTVTAQPEEGVATATLNIASGTPVGSHRVLVSYADTTNVNGLVNYRPASEAAYFSVTPAATAVQATGVILAGNGSQMVATLTAQVTSAGNTVNEGQVTFVWGGIKVTTTVDSAGRAVVSVPVPGGMNLGGAPVAVQYADPAGNFQTSNSRQTLTLAPASSLLPGLPGPTATGWQVLKAAFFGQTPAVTLDSQGRLGSFAFGGFQGMLAYDTTGFLLQVTVDGVPVFPTA
jgi:hypothetical protein